MGSSQAKQTTTTTWNLGGNLVPVRAKQTLPMRSLGGGGNSDHASWAHHGGSQSSHNIIKFQTVMDNLVIYWFSIGQQQASLHCTVLLPKALLLCCIETHTCVQIHNKQKGQIILHLTSCRHTAYEVTPLAIVAGPVHESPTLKACKSRFLTSWPWPLNYDLAHRTRYSPGRLPHKISCPYVT